MKKRLPYALSFLGWCALMFGCGWFIELSPNPAEWPAATRFLIALAGPFLGGIFTVIFYNVEESNQENE